MGFIGKKLHFQWIPRMISWRCRISSILRCLHKESTRVDKYTERRDFIWNRRRCLKAQTSKLEFLMNFNESWRISYKTGLMY